MSRIGDELSRKKISIKMFAAFLGVSERTAWNKLNGVTEFSISEGLKTQQELLPEYDLGWLFGDE